MTTLTLNDPQDA